MKLFYSSILTSVAVLSFTACGGGSSSSNAVSVPDSSSTSTPTSTITSKALRGSNGAAATGSVSLSGGTYTYTYNGTEVNVSPTGLSAGNVLNLTSGGIKTVTGGTTYSYSRFGGISTATDLTKSELYYIGAKTASMPTTGTATYSGQIVDNNLANSAATFNVNYGAKTITSSSLALNGTITGSDFAGTVTGGTFNGSFFGPKAEELGGVGTTNGSGFSFGAKK
jgi:hypothetical protein